MPIHLRKRKENTPPHAREGLSETILHPQKHITTPPKHTRKDGNIVITNILIMCYNVGTSG